MIYQLVWARLKLCGRVTLAYPIVTALVVFNFVQEVFLSIREGFENCIVDGRRDYRRLHSVIAGAWKDAKKERVETA